MKYKKWLERHRLEFTLIPDKKSQGVPAREKPGEDKPQEIERGPPRG